MGEKNSITHSKNIDKITSNELSKHERILKSTAELFILKGYANVSTEEIAKEAGVSKGLIFHHFNSKDDLAFEVFKNLVQNEMGLDSLNESASEKMDPIRVIRNFVTETLTQIQLNPGSSLLLMDLLINVKNTQINQKIKTFLADYLTNFIELFGTLGFKNPELKARTLFAILDGLAFQFLFTEEGQTEITPDDFVNEIMQMLER